MMSKVHILTTRYSPNSVAFNFPFIIHQRSLRENGILIRLVFKEVKDIFECDVLFINSKWFRAKGRLETERFLEIAERNADRILWFDTTDSTGTTQFFVMPFVDGYYKAQVFRERERYLKEYYGNRIYTDFYHKVYGISDIDNSYRSISTTKKNLKKIFVSWNSALGDHGRYGLYYNNLRERMPFPFFYSGKFINEERNRKIDLSCRIGYGYGRNTLRFQRKRIAEILAGTYALDTKKLSRKKYYLEIENAKIGISPFGCGEITLRDFEIVIGGAALLKPDMSHVETWPELYVADETYVGHSWDFLDFSSKIEYLLEKDRFFEISENARNLYRKYLLPSHDEHEFVKRVSAIVKRHL